MVLLKRQGKVIEAGSDEHVRLINANLIDGHDCHNIRVGSKIRMSSNSLSYSYGYCSAMEPILGSVQTIGDIDKHTGRMYLENPDDDHFVSGYTYSIFDIDKTIKY